MHYRDITKYFFSNKVINRWNSLDQRTVDVSSINVFKSRLIYDTLTGVCLNLDLDNTIYVTSPELEPDALWSYSENNNKL